ncbi:MAG TPA: aminoacetone oxidase family FAD-binding enzyme [Myxococcota bacterium]|nr:aminoacetone oxidase family FAD-binding enzyme [Myxococcota bacterium]
MSAEHAAGDVWPLVVIGAGAAGLLAALFAARGGVRTLLLESHAKPGAKIRVSGGGRCNVLPSRAEPADFHSEGSRNALRNVLLSWPLADVRAFFEHELGIALKVEASGKVFPASDDPSEVTHALLGACARAGVTLRAGARVSELRAANAGGADDARFELALASGERIRAARVALCTGGLSLPKTGSDGWGYQAAERLGHRLRRRYPALVPLLTPGHDWPELAGVSVRARLSVFRGGRLLEARTGDLLFTHRGVSGPVVLDISHWLARADHQGVALRAAWLGDDVAAWDARLREGGARSVQNLLRAHLPRRLADVLLARAAVDPSCALARLSREPRARLAEVLGDCSLEIAGDEGYRTAEVTGGGVALDEVVTRTLESRLAPGLYFAGEILDVTGRIGGFNFLWAWVTGRKVGLAAAESERRPAQSARQ